MILNAIPADKIELRLLEYFPVNFFNFNIFFEQTVTHLFEEFYTSMNSIASYIKIIMIFAIVISFCIKFLEYLDLSNFYFKILKIMNIFMRVNMQDSISELYFSKRMINSLKDSNETYLNISGLERIVAKINIDLPKETTRKNHFMQKNYKDKLKKNSNRRKDNNIKQLSKLSLIVLICSSYLLLFSFYFFNYYYSNISNKNVEQLIDVSKFFVVLEALPNNIMIFNRIILREKFLNNTLYNFPNKNEREKKLFGIVQERTAMLSSFLSYVSFYSTNSELQKNKNISSILYGSICEILFNQSAINEEEFRICKTILNGVFNKGIVNVISELLNSLKSEEFLLTPSVALSFSQKEEQKKFILKYLESDIDIERIMTQYFLIKTFEIFINGMQSFYINYFLDQIIGLKALIFISTIFIFSLTLTIIFTGRNYLKNLHLNVCFVLNIIPFERILNDDQTVFLIKKHYKDD